MNFASGPGSCQQMTINASNTDSLQTICANSSSCIDMTLNLRFGTEDYWGFESTLDPFDDFATTDGDSGDHQGGGHEHGDIPTDGGDPGSGAGPEPHDEPSQPPVSVDKPSSPPVDEHVPSDPPVNVDVPSDPDVTADEHGDPVVPGEDSEIPPVDGSQSDGTPEDGGEPDHNGVVHRLLSGYFISSLLTSRHATSYFGRTVNVMFLTKIN